MPTQDTQPPAGLRRTSVYLDGYGHTNPIPVACRIDNLVYSSIVHGIDPARTDGEPPTLEQQAELMFNRISDIVRAAGGTTEDIVSVTMRMRNRSDRTAVNRFWVAAFPDENSRPARQTINAELDGDQLIQCDFVAVIDSHEHEREDGRS